MMIMKNILKAMVKIGSFLWKELESARLQNVIALASLAVTAWLTLYIFQITNQQQESIVEVEIDSMPPHSSWEFFIRIRNDGPSDITNSSIRVQLVADNSSLKLIGFEARNLFDVVQNPSWIKPAPTPYESKSGFYLIPIGYFETDSSYFIHLVFSVENELHQELLIEWNDLEIQTIKDATDGSESYNFSDINQEKYAEFLKHFIQNVYLSGQNVKVFGISTLLNAP